MKENRWMSLLGLANRARQITSGEELTVKQIQRGNAKLVLLSADASRNTTKKITDKCNSYEVPLKVVENRYLLGQAIGKDARVVVAVLDDGFAKKLVTLLD
ncbi:MULTISPECIES: YlxQ family RNA-binding protein [Neobacillus]|jgi:ribosomal protein L7Ae-like RNA K-turn-binding protein|uniref:YlxQ family RNA-binding protein n=1 Tax=Neobacillus sedimentimangrovi TaxID=2699460 RepID=A0ABS8QDJ3_9BACI|nr:YlxQ family RNA-binding protein [Neobacillus sedimentimangrovi]AIM17708.1 50S ribosomal protein L7 [Bacillus sp. X1(2014)]MCD4837358.1 YlxQ family RNA-binding protein [Neobacillus sedimentimangrovi]